jgi:hypothetical protein
MKIVIHYDECEWPIDTEKPPEESLDLLLDTFTQPQVRLIINEALPVFRGMCDVWNQRELAARREAGLGEGG